MSEVKVNKISPRSGTTVTLGDSGDTFTGSQTIANAALQGSGQVTINGVSVALGGSTTIPTETQPVISSFTPTVIDADVGGTITITGQNFASIPKVELQRANGAFQSATTVTFTSATSISFTTGTAGLTNGQNVRILVTNPDGNAARSSSDLTISDGPAFTTTSLPNGESGQSYSQNIDVTADSATTIAVNTGSSLPSGITLGSTSNVSGSTYRAVLSGTLPTTANETTYNFTLKATDAQSQVTTQALSITAEVGINNSGGFC